MNREERATSRHRPTTIAIDGMGGTRGLEVTSKVAAELSLKRDLRVLLVGDAEAINEHLYEQSYDPAFLSVAHAPEVVPVEANPLRALDQWPRASIVRAVQLLGDDKADALVTAGHAGVTITAARHSLAMLPGVRRAAIASVLPTQRQKGGRKDPFSLILDVGATHHASADELVSFALMGVAYARIIGQNEHPSVGLLSSNAVTHLVPPTVAQAHARLSELAESRQFQLLGYIDGYQIPKGEADVVVCDGFTGGVVVRLLEGMADAFEGLTQAASDHRLLWRVGLSMLSEGLEQVRRLIEWEQYGGAPVLGFERPIIVTHADSGELAMHNAVKVAVRVVRAQMMEQIAGEFQAPSEESEDE